MANHSDSTGAERVVAAERVLADVEEREAGEAGDQQADADRDGALGERRSG